MSNNFDKAGALGRHAFDNGLKSFAALSKGAQAIVAETNEYAKKSIEDSSAAWQSVISAKSIEMAIELQSAYVKTSYETLVAEATKLGSLYADLARDTCKPFEDALPKAR